MENFARLDVIVRKKFYLKELPLRKRTKKMYEISGNILNIDFMV